MAKAGMRRPDPEDPHGTESNRKGHFPKNQEKPVAELQGKAKLSNEKATPIRYDNADEATRRKETSCQKTASLTTRKFGK